MPSHRVEFAGAEGLTLAGRLELPDGAPRAYALFAHCFTCSKDIAAATRISRALSELGLGVLRFDFTGLGNSEGDFENTNFTSNVADLVAAARFLNKHYGPAQLLVGHSFGGAAVLHAALELPDVRAVATIAAPSSPTHLRQLLGDDAQSDDRAVRVKLGGREFRIKRSFFDDLELHDDSSRLRELQAAKMIMHSPSDEVVSVDEAARLFGQLSHPKSFVSLDQANHLLSERRDSQYVAQVLAAWAFRYLESDQASESKTSRSAEGEVLVTGGAEGFRTQVQAGSHAWTADEPQSAGGGDTGPSPYDMLLASLGTCTSMTLHLYARRKKWPLERVSVTLKHEREHCKDSADCGEGQKYLERLVRLIDVEGDLDQAQKSRLLQIAEKCPVHRTLQHHPQVVTKPAWQASEDEA